MKFDFKQEEKEVVVKKFVTTSVTIEMSPEIASLFLQFLSNTKCRPDYHFQIGNQISEGMHIGDELFNLWAQLDNALSDGVIPRVTTSEGPMAISWAVDYSNQID